ncbi:MAG: BlaI/MecI/CopY family transcriptional regulator [Planctomycetota bacterium]|nr:BlaI/MecI/CopY family transcriptional regulator [Planctomycetota bacterium]
MSKKKTKIGQEELAVFRFIQQTHPVTVRQVADHFAGAGKARTTILTMMERLRTKGLLSRDETSGANRYSPAVEPGELMQSLVGDFVTKILGGSVSPFVAYMTEAGEISDEELAELKQAVRDLDKRRQDNK